MNQTLEKNDALIIVDVQNDFCPGGALPIKDGDAIVPVLNKWISRALDQKIPIYVSRDWHPRGHISFLDQGGKWPPHCLQDTHGAAFHPELHIPPSAIKITKGVRFDQDQNSAFHQTGLARELRRKEISRLWIGGLALDVCVLATALDAHQEEFKVNLILDATRPVTTAGGEKAIQQMKKAGIAFISHSK